MDIAILNALGLSEAATADEAIKAINALKDEKSVALNRATTPDLTKFVPRADFDIAMNKVSTYEAAAKATQDAEIVAAVDAAVEAGKIAPASKGYHLAACKAEGGLVAFNSMVANAPNIAGTTALDGKKAPDQSTALSDEQKALCRQIGVSEADFIKTLQSKSAN